MAARVLVVEDDLGTLRAIAEILREEGFDAPCDADPRHALARLREGEQFGVVVLDRYMPRISGEQFVELMRGELGLSHVPILLISGSPVDLPGVDAFLRKPIERDDLVDTLLRLAGLLTPPSAG